MLHILNTRLLSTLHKIQDFSDICFDLRCLKRQTSKNLKNLNQLFSKGISGRKISNQFDEYKRISSNTCSKIVLVVFSYGNLESHILLMIFFN